MSQEFYLLYEFLNKRYLKCTPKPLCFPEQSKQIHIPYVTLTHCGLCPLHSKHAYGKLSHLVYAP